MQSKTHKLQVVVVFLICSIIFSAEFLTSSAGQEQGKRLFELVGVEVPFEQRAGVDDGFAFVVHFGGDSHGNLDTCG